MGNNKRVRYIWPEEAKRLVEKALRIPDKKPNARLLAIQLQEMTGFSLFACWRFLERHGIRRPGAGKRLSWDDSKIVHAMEHGYDETVQKYSCSKRAAYSAVVRYERMVGPCNGGYSLRQLSKLLTVRTEQIKFWIRAGYLEATPTTFGRKETFIVSDAQLSQFLKKYAGGLMSSSDGRVAPRRLPDKRLKFISYYVFDKHMDLGLLRTRESKKEGDAYREYQANRDSDFSLDGD